MFRNILCLTLLVTVCAVPDGMAQTAVRWRGGGDPRNMSKLEQIGRIHPALPKTKLLNAEDSLFEVDDDAGAGDEVVGRVNLANNSFEEAHFSITGGTGRKLFSIEDFVNSRGKWFGVVRVLAGGLAKDSYTLKVKAQFANGITDEQEYTIHKVEEPLAERFLNLKEKELLRNRRLSASAPDDEIEKHLRQMGSDGSFNDLPYTMGSVGWTNTCTSAERLLTFATAYLDRESGFHKSDKLKKAIYKGVVRNAEQNARFRTDWADTHVWRNSDYIAGIGIRFCRMLRNEMDDENESVSRSATEAYDAIMDVCDVMWAERMFERPAIGNANRNHRMRSLITRAAVSYDYNRALTDQDVWYDTVDPRSQGYYPNGALGDVMELIETGFVMSDTYINRNGFFPDGTICHHPAVGIQFTADAYGWPWLVENSIPMAGFLKNTKYRAKDSTYNIIADRLLDAYRPLTFNGYLDMSVGGLTPDRSKWGPRLLKAVTDLIDSKSDDTVIEREPELIEFKRILEQNSFVDEMTVNQPFWNIDYLVHRRPGYFASVKMMSKRSRGLERGVDKKSYYYLGDGALFVRVNNDDYNGLDKVYNWHAIPGTTAEQCNDALPLDARSAFPGANGTNTFAGVVSDGRYGFGAFVYERNHDDDGANYSTVNAHKGYFFFEDEIVALGNNIRRVRPGDGQAIWTTLNQVAWNSDIVCCVEGKTRISVPLDGPDEDRDFENVTSPIWFHHDNVGYVILPESGPVNMKMSAENRGRGKKMFHLAIDHGKEPVRDTYRYVILPTASIDDVERFVRNIDGTSSTVVLQNSKRIMAVQNGALRTAQVAFYKEGAVSISSGTDKSFELSVDRPALVMVREREEKVSFTVTDPNHSMDDPDIAVSVNRELSGPNCYYDSGQGISRLVFTHSNEEVLAGKPVTESYRLAGNESLWPAPVLESETPADVHKTLLYSCSFDKEDDIADWVMEGPGIARVDDGKLLIYPEFQEALVDHLAKENIEDPNPDQKVYSEKLVELMTQRFPDTIQEYYHEDGKAFRGGHIVFWNKHATPENFQIEFDFRSISEYPLHMVLFSAMGTGGQDIFDPSLKKRNGIAPQYMRGDIQNYRVSFFAADRGTSNMRKAPGRHMSGQGPDLAALDPDSVHAIRVTKWDGTVRFHINDRLVFAFEDEEPLSGGHWGLRLMALARAHYDNFKVYELKTSSANGSAKRKSAWR